MKKNDKIKILLGIIVFMVIMTWFVASGSFHDGLFISEGLNRAGLLETFKLIYYGLYYRLDDVFFLLCLGGLYEVLIHTLSYRKLVTKTTKFIADKEIPAALVTLFVMGLLVSIMGEPLIALILVPFIATVFLRRGRDRITAFAIAFGGLFIGIIGTTLGTSGFDYLMEATKITVTSLIGYKIAMFVLTYAIYSIFLVLRMKKQYKLVNHTKYDMFNIEKLTEEEVKDKKAKMWPTMTLIGILVFVSLFAYINWSTSFGVTFFEGIPTALEKVTVSDIPVLSNFLGKFDALGNWGDLVSASFVLFTVALIIASVNKISIDEFIEYEAKGCKKISKVIFIYILAVSMLMVGTFYPWGNTVINALLGQYQFNMFLLVFVGLIGGLLFVEPEFVGFILADVIAVNYASNLVSTSLIIHWASSIVVLIAPTSYLLMMGLTYLDIPYTNWVKYIWKFFVAIIVILILLLCVMCYM